MMRHTGLGIAITAVMMAATGLSFAMSERPAAGVTADNAFTLSNAAQTMTVGAAEIAHANETAHWGMLSYEMSKIAAENASNPLVRQFAKFEMSEQATMADILKDVYPNMPKPTLLEDEQQMLDSMKTTKGANLDRMYVNLQVDAHQKLLTTQDAYLKSGTYLGQRNIARMAKGMIEQHLALLQAYTARK